MCCACCVTLLTRVLASQLDAREEQLAVWTCCRLTRQQLGGEDGKAAVVRGRMRLRVRGHRLLTLNSQAMCQLGYLYNREPLLQSLKEHLVDGVPMPPLAKHVVSLKDLTTLQLAPSSSEAAAAPAVAASTGDFRAATHVRYACPLTGAPRCFSAWRGEMFACCLHSCLADIDSPGLELNGRFKFVALRPSGVVVSERALKQVRALPAPQRVLSGLLTSA